MTESGASAFGDEPGAMACTGADCFCKQGLAVHPPVLMIFDPDRGEYAAAAGERCMARWASTGPGRMAGQICGREATEEVGDAWVCDHHHKRARQWARERDGRSLVTAKEHVRQVGLERMRLDRERAAQQIELDKKRILAEEAARSEHSLVYYVQRESDGLIKIGTSRTIHGRMAALKTAYGPLRLLATHGGTHIEEHAIHNRFSGLLAEGREWFKPGLPAVSLTAGSDANAAPEPPHYESVSIDAGPCRERASRVYPQVRGYAGMLVRAGFSGGVRGGVFRPGSRRSPVTSVVRPLFERRNAWRPAPRRTEASDWDERDERDDWRAGQPARYHVRAPGNAGAGRWVEVLRLYPARSM